MSAIAWTFQPHVMHCQATQVKELYRLTVIIPLHLSTQITREELFAEIQKAGDNLYRGKLFFGGRLRIAGRPTPNHLVLEENPRFSSPLSTRLIISPEHIRAGGLPQVGKPEEAIAAELWQAEAENDLLAIVRILAEDHPLEIKAKIKAGEAGKIIASQNAALQKKILVGICDGILKVHTALVNRQQLTIYHFLKEEDRAALRGQVKTQETSEGKSSGFFYDCFCSLKRHLEALETSFQAGVIAEVEAQAKGMEGEIFAVRRKIEEITGVTLEQILAGEGEIPVARLNAALAEGAKVCHLLPVSTAQYLAREISEARRRDIMEKVQKSGLSKNKKEILLPFLAQDQTIDIIMYDFTDPLLAGAVLAAAMRGAKVRIIFDLTRSAGPHTVYDRVKAVMDEFCEQYGIEKELAPFQCRTYPTGSTKGRSSLHLKCWVLGSGDYAMGSLNLTRRGLETNVEGMQFTENDREGAEEVRQIFDRLWNYQGNVLPFPSKVTAQSWWPQTHFEALEFEAVPSAEQVEAAFAGFSRVRGPMDVKMFLVAIREAREQGARIKIRTRGEGAAFNAFRLEFENPVIADVLLPSYIEGSLLAEFMGAPASRGGQYHPGYTIRIAGLKQHSEMVVEIVNEICRMQGVTGKEKDKTILAALLHDTAKAELVGKDGEHFWAFYNKAHGQAAAEKLKKVYAALTPEQKQVFTPEDLEDVCYGMEGHMTVFDDENPHPLSAEARPILFRVALADMIASRKYMYVENRASLPMDRAEAIDQMLNNPFSIQGVGWQQLKEERLLFDFVRTHLKLGRDYNSLKPRTKKLLRVAESLCKQFQIEEKDAPKEEALEAKKTRLQENQAKAARRAEIFAAAIILGECGYAKGVEAWGKSQKHFTRAMKDLREQARRRGIRINHALDLAEQAFQSLEDPYRVKEGKLVPATDSALWILLTANCVMTSSKMHVITNTEVEKHLASAQLPHTTWQGYRFKEKEVEALARGLEKLLLTTYRQEFLPETERMLLAAVYGKRRQKAERIPEKILNALVDRFGTVFPQAIYDQFYRPMSQHFRDRFAEDLRECSHPEKLLEQIGPACRRSPKPAPVFGLMARTCMANGVKTIAEAKKLIADARDRQRLGQYDYFKGIQAGADHLAGALARGEKICIYGDYDVDGEFASTILVKAFRNLRYRILVQQGMEEEAAIAQAEKDVIYYIPHRQHEGYGLNHEFLRYSVRQGIKHVVTVDCGIKDKDLVEQAKQMGISMVITDHHQPDPNLLPNAAVAVIDPKAELAPDHSAHDLSGGGVAYKLMRAVVDKTNEAYLKERPFEVGNRYQDLVAATTIADVCPMLGENRAFVHYGLAMIEKRMQEERMPKDAQGGEALAVSPEAKAADPNLAYVAEKMALEVVDPQAVSFTLGPFFNATGRIGHPHSSLRLLCSRTDAEREKEFEQILPLLYERREIEGAILEDAEKQLKDPAIFNPETDRGIAIAGEFHRGVIGIVASRVREIWGYPVVIMGTSGEEEVYGSMRAPEHVSAIQILDQCQQRYQEETGEPLFERYGGHFGAAGFKLKAGRVADFQRVYKEVCKEVVGDKIPPLGYVGRFAPGDISLARVIFFNKLLGPFGNHFKEPLFRTLVPVTSWEVFGPMGNHIHGKAGEKGELAFTHFRGNTRAAKRVLFKGKEQAVGAFQVSAWRGKKKDGTPIHKEELQFLVTDLKFAPSHKRQKT